MRIIITSKSGYIACALCEYFTKIGDNAKQVSFRKDVSDISIDGAETVIHCAAVVHKKESDYAPLYDSVNHIKTVEFAKKAKAAGVKRFVLFSTMNVYGVGEGAINKQTPCRPVTLYGKSKLAAERDILALQSDSFNVIILRPPMVYGKNCPGNFSRLKKLAEITPIFPLVDNKRSMLYIENLVYAVNDIVKSNKNGIITLMDGQYINTSALVKKLAGNKNIYMSKLLGAAAVRIPLGVFKKVFGSLYYEGDDVYKCDYVDADSAIKRSI